MVLCNEVQKYRNSEEDLEALFNEIHRFGQLLLLEGCHVCIRKSGHEAEEYVHYFPSLVRDTASGDWQPS